jgi:hypothetical protein
MITQESGLLGMADKGMSDKEEPRLITPFKKTAVRQAMRSVTGAAEKGRVQRSCTTFNMEIGSHRVYNEIMIGDLGRWAAARGMSFKKTYIDIDNAKKRIEICRGLTNFVYRMRGLG